MKKEQIQKLNEAIIQKTQCGIISVREYSKYGGFDGYRDICTIEIAKHLHNEGYRKQEWISVKEALPEEFVSVLGYMTDAGDFPPVRECYKVGGVFFFPALGDRHPVSHWMPIPDPPKGERG